MAHLQYMPGDPRLVDQLVYELKSKGIFDQFRKECIADVDTRPAYQNLRQRVESSVATFLARQCWKPDLNKNQLREKLRKHILDGNYLEQGVERIVDQVVNPKVASVFIPQVEDLVYNYLGITRKKTLVESPEKTADLLPTDLEAVSPGSVKSNDDKEDVSMDIDSNTADKMETDKEQPKEEIEINGDKKNERIQNSITEILSSNESDGSMDKSSIPLPSEEIRLENIPEPENSPPKAGEVELEKIALPKEQVPSTDIPLPEEIIQKEPHFKPILLHSEDSNSSSGSSLRRNMSPLTPIRNYNNENSCDAQQAFETDAKLNDKEPSSFRFTIEAENSPDNKKREPAQSDLAYQFNNQVNINSFNTPLYDDSSNSNNLRIDYESDANSKANIDTKPEAENTEERKEKRDDRKSHKSSHRSRDSHRHSSSKDKRSDSKHSTSRDGSKHDKKSSSKDDPKKSNKDSRDRSKDRSDKKENRDSSKHRSSRSSSRKDSKSHRSSSSSHRHSSKPSDDKKISSSHREKEKDNKDKSSTKDRSKDSKSSHRSEKDRKSSSSKKSDEKDKKKDKKDIDDHYSSSGRGNHGRRSTDRDSNDGSSSSKGSNNQNGSKSSDKKGGSKSSGSKSDNTSTTSGDTSSPSDKDQKLQVNQLSQFKPAVRVDNHLETPIANPPRLPFVPDITLKKPKFAANLAEARQMMKMRKFLDEEQKRMNQEAALLLEFQANVRPSLSQVYSSIPGPELEFACGANTIVNPSQSIESVNENLDNSDESDYKDVIQPAPQSVQQIFDIILGNPSEFETPDQKNIETYDENKPFSKLVEEIGEYSKASENKVKLEKVNDQPEESKEEDNASDPTQNIEVTVNAENVTEFESEEQMDIDEGKIVEEIESPPFEYLTKNPDVIDNKTEIQDIIDTKLEVNPTDVEENEKDLVNEKKSLKTEEITEDIKIPDDTKIVVKVIQEEDCIEESIENIKECVENGEVVINIKDEHIESQQSFVNLNQEEMKEMASSEQRTPERIPHNTKKEMEILEIVPIKGNEANKVPDIAPIKQNEANTIPEIAPIIANIEKKRSKKISEEKKIAEIVPINDNEANEKPEKSPNNASKVKKGSENISKEKTILENMPLNTVKEIIPETVQATVNKDMESPVFVPLNANKDENTQEVLPTNVNKSKKDPEIAPLNTVKEKNIPKIATPTKENKKNKVPEIEPFIVSKEKKVSKEFKEDKKISGNLPHNEMKNKQDKKSIEPVKQMDVLDIEDEIKIHEILKYFTNDEIITAQSEREEFSKFFKSYSDFTNKLYLINCDTYEENIINDVAKKFGNFEIVNYFKNGHTKVPTKTKNIVKDIRLSQELTLPTKAIFSPTKSECSFELSSEYDAKLNEIVNKKSRQEVMEIILGGVIDELPKTSNGSPKTSNESQTSNESGKDKNLKRKGEIESSVNEKRSILTPTKLRKLSNSDQISSTTDESEEMTSNNNKVQVTTRSKYLGRAKRVGLSRPKRYNQVNSPSSDKSVENYVQNTPPTAVNGKIKSTPRSKVQRYDTSDLYKPKLHYLSRRNPIT